MSSTGDGPSIGTRDIDSVAERAYEYNFFQLVRVLQSLIGREQQSATAGSGDHIRFRPSPATVFPPTDVRGIEPGETDDDPLTIVVSFMGLYGFDSPLPSYFSKELEQEQPSSEPLRDLLDIFNNRLYRFLYLAWQKYHPWTVGRAEGIDRATRRMMAVSGLVSDAESPTEDRRPALGLTPLSGQLGSAVSNADGLRNILRFELAGLDVEVEEFVPRWVRLHERPGIGRSAGGAQARLGTNAAIGERMHDISGKFRVKIGPMGLEEFESCLPGRERANRIALIIDRYVTDMLEYDVKLELRSADVPPLVLGTSRRLGQNTWLNRPDDRTTSRLVSYVRDDA